MRKLFVLLPVLAGLFLSACAGEVGKSVVSLDAGSVLGKDLAAAKFNLSSAVEVGALPADDPALGCLTSLVADLGSEDGATFTPQRAGLVSEGALVYIRAQQAKALKEGFKLPSDCDAIVGRFVIDSAKAGGKLLPGAGLLLR